MTTLDEGQAALHSQIQARAIELGHDPEKIRPVYDGVMDAEAYLAAKPKILRITIPASSSSAERRRFNA